MFKVIDARPEYRIIDPVSAVSKSNNSESFQSVLKQPDGRVNTRVKKQESDFKKVFDREIAKLK